MTLLRYVSVCGCVDKTRVCEPALPPNRLEILGFSKCKTAKCLIQARIFCIINITNDDCFLIIVGDINVILLATSLDLTYNIISHVSQCLMSVAIYVHCIWLR